MPLKKGKPPLKVRFAQNVAEYRQHLYEIFENFVGTPPRVQGAGTPQIRGGGARDRKQFKLIVIQN